MMWECHPQHLYPEAGHTGVIMTFYMIVCVDLTLSKIQNEPWQTLWKGTYVEQFQNENYCMLWCIVKTLSVCLLLVKFSQAGAWKVEFWEKVYPDLNKCLHASLPWIWSNQSKKCLSVLCPILVLYGGPYRRKPSQYVLSSVCVWTSGPLQDLWRVQR